MRLFPHIIYVAHDKTWKNAVTKPYLYGNVFGDSHTPAVEVYYMTDSHVIVVETILSVDIAVPSIVLWKKGVNLVGCGRGTFLKKAKAKCRGMSLPKKNVDRS